MEQEMKKTYKKPNLKFVSMRNEKSVAKTCWGNHGKGTQYYYDIEGPGWVHFYIDSTNCSMYELTVMYCERVKGPDGETFIQENIATDEQRQKLYDAIKTYGGGNEGQPFKDDNFPHNPNPSWS